TPYDRPAPASTAARTRQAAFGNPVDETGRFGSGCSTRSKLRDRVEHYPDATPARRTGPCLERERLEATTGIEPVWTDLQSAASPLRHVAKAANSLGFGRSAVKALLLSPSHFHSGPIPFVAPEFPAPARAPAEHARRTAAARSRAFA